MLDDPENGKWDDQFPVADLLSQLPENWPIIIERDRFVDAHCLTQNVTQRK